MFVFVGKSSLALFFSFFQFPVPFRHSGGADVPDQLPVRKFGYGLKDLKGFLQASVRRYVIIDVFGQFGLEDQVGGVLFASRWARARLNNGTLDDETRADSL
jgi:hypothetical protein